MEVIISRATKVDVAVMMLGRTQYRTAILPALTGTKGPTVALTLSKCPTDSIKSKPISRVMDK